MEKRCASGTGIGSLLTRLFFSPTISWAKLCTVMQAEILPYLSEILPSLIAIAAQRVRVKEVGCGSLRAECSQCKVEDNK